MMVLNILSAIQLSLVPSAPAVPHIEEFSSIQFGSVAQFCLTLCDPMNCSMTGFPIHHQLPELLRLISIESVMPNLILCHPLLFPLSIFPSIGVFSNESVLHIRWSKYWSFSFSISPSNEYSRLISFRIDSLTPCSSRDSQESSPTPQFKSINSSALCFLYSSTFTSIHDYWKNHSFDQTDLCRQNNVSAF